MKSVTLCGCCLLLLLPVVCMGAKADARIMQAAWSGDIAMVKRILKANPAQANARDDSGNTPLLLAIRRYHTDVAKLLLEGGADPNATSTEKPDMTPLFYAAWHADPVLVKLLLAKGANPNGKRDAHILFGDISDARPLWVLGGSDGKRYEMNPEAAAERVAVARMLVAAGAEVNGVPLHKLDCAPLTEFFLANGADPNARDTRGDTPLHQALTLRAAKALLAKGAEADAEGESGCTPLVNATWRENLELVKLLLEKGANPNGKGDKRPLQVFCSRYQDPRSEASREVAAVRVAIARLLVAAGATVKDLPLHKLDCAPLTEFFLASGADPNLMNPSTLPTEGGTPLHQALTARAAKALLAKGAGVDATDANGYTPLVRAAERGLAEVVKVLVAAGAKVNNIGQYETLQPPLNEAARSGSLETVQALLDAGADVNLVSKFGGDPETALHRAAFQGNPAVIRLLLAHGMNTNDTRGVHGNTPLHYAAGGQVDAVDVLLKAGADRSLKNREGQTALDQTRDPNVSKRLRTPN